MLIGTALKEKRRGKLCHGVLLQHGVVPGRQKWTAPSLTVFARPACLPPVTTICMQSWRNSWQDGNLLTTSILRTLQVAGWRSPVWARGFVVCRISPPRFLAECRKRWLNQASFVLLCFVLFVFSGLCLPVVFVMSVFNLSSVRIFQHVPSWMALYSLCVLMWLTLRNYSLTAGWTTKMKNSTTESSLWKNPQVKCISVGGDYVEKWQSGTVDRQTDIYRKFI